MWVCKEHCAPEIIGKFLICGGKVDKTNNHGKTPLHIMAAHRSSFDCLQILLAHGANPNDVFVQLERTSGDKLYFSAG